MTLFDPRYSCTEVDLVLKARPFAKDDIPEICAFLGDIRQAINHNHYLHVGDLLWQLFHMLADYNPSDMIRLWQDEQGRLLGFALAYPAFGGFELQVHPSFRSLDLEREMFNWVQYQLTLLNPDCPTRYSLVNEHDTLRLNMLEADNYHPLGDWLYMQRSLATLFPTPQVPSAFRISDMTEVDFASRATVLGEAFGTPPRPRLYQQFMNARGYDPTLDIVTVDSSGQAASFAMCWVDPLSKVGQFEPVGTLPQFWRQGLGKATLLEGMRRMRDRGMHNLIVIVEAAEEPAYHLYKSLGLETRWTIRQYGKTLR